jgi:hypothetical protein
MLVTGIEGRWVSEKLLLPELFGRVGVLAPTAIGNVGMSELVVVVAPVFQLGGVAALPPP